MVVESESTSFVLYVEAEVMGVCGATVVTWWLFGSITLFSTCQRKMVALIIKDLSLYSANAKQDSSFYLKSR